MKPLFCVAICVATLFSTSCKKISELTKFDLKYNTEGTIQAGLGTLVPFDVNTPDVPTQSQEEFEGHNTGKNLIQAVQLKELKISIITPEDQNFDFLKNVEVYISAEGQQEVKIAWKSDLPDTQAKEIVLDCADTNLKNYIMSDKYKLRLKTTTDKVLNKDVDVKIANTFRVDANVLGL